ncbi:MAG: HAD-IA family hydrolase [Alphaproteobacteria bacterium]|nr:HAD-IA family hydrolase [Alphaproteobacteria bacterium]MBU6471233.1 HAD-IA family hydrolase [Alphaproteobacteria bacterium]MDE2350497.1 HAD-IA family hydrolase [Alphaproteobacteria bacterium]
MIEAVIWDFGGVFTTSPFEAFARYERRNGLPEGLIRRINSDNHLENAWARFERAEIDLDTFDREFAAEARALGHEVPGRDIIPLLTGDFRADMIEALRRIKTRFKTGCITNNVPSMQMSGADTPSNLYKREVLELFDRLIESSKLGLRKPDPKIYVLMCEALAVAPADCIYLDDLGVNLKPARALGMTTIKVESGPQAIAELEAATGMTLR